MELRFKDSAGYNMVLQPKNVLENDCNGNIRDTSVPFNDAFRVCTKVNMSMVFEIESRLTTMAYIILCPRCHLPATVEDGAVVTW